MRVTGWFAREATRHCGRRAKRKEASRTQQVFNGRFGTSILTKMETPVMFDVFFETKEPKVAATSFG